MLVIHSGPSNASILTTAVLFLKKKERRNWDLLGGRQCLLLMVNLTLFNTCAFILGMMKCSADEGAELQGTGRGEDGVVSQFASCLHA